MDSKAILVADAVAVALVVAAGMEATGVSLAAEASVVAVVAFGVAVVAALVEEMARRPSR
jgi:hypothetical protein